MIVFMENTIVLTDAERLELNQRVASRSGRAAWRPTTGF
jgi:hypothetical protein